MNAGQPRAAVLFAAVFIAGLSMAAASGMVAQSGTSLGDLNRQPIPQSSLPSGFVDGGGTVYFRASLPDVGAELCRIDPVTGVWSLVHDIRPGPGGSAPAWLTWHAGRLWFTADDGTHGIELWSSDGTAAGTALVADIRPGSSSSRPVQLTGLNNSVLMAADDGVVGRELWSHDTGSGRTSLLADTLVGVSPGDPAGLIAWQGRVWFRACNPTSGCELWSSDGTTVGTAEFVDLAPGSSSGFPTDFLVLNNRLLFNALTNATGRELFSCDGQNVTLVRDVVPGPRAGARFDLRAQLGNRAVFQSEEQIWVTDGTTAGTVAVFTGPPGFFPGFLVGDGARACFIPFGTTELWVTDGTTVGTRAIVDVNPGGVAQLVPDSAQLDPVAGRGVVFPVNDRVGGQALWVSDGTAAGSRALASFPTRNGVGPTNLVESPSGGALFYGTSRTLGTELWHTDGTVAGTAVLANLVEDPPGNSDPEFMCDLFGATLFSADNGLDGRELWVSDGTASGTRMLLDIRPGPESSNPTGMTRLGNRVVFGADDGVLGAELWVSDGTAMGTLLLRDLVTGSGASDPSSFVRVDGQLWFVADDVAAETQFWSTDGTAAGTVLLDQGILPPNSGVDIREPTLVGDLVCFTVDVQDFRTGGFESELWSSDGTRSGTQLVKDIFPGTRPCGFGSRCPNSSTPRDLVNWRGRLYFTAEDGVHGRELWVSDGSDAGTQLAVDIRPGPLPGARGLAVFRDRLWFAGDDGSSGWELWTSNGTVSGTSRFADLRGGSASSTPRDFARVGTRWLYFSADDGVSGAELWATDGSLGGTRLAAEFRPGPLSGGPKPWVRSADRGIDRRAALGSAGGLVVTADDGVIGREPWFVSSGATATPVRPGSAEEAWLETSDPLLGMPATLRGNRPPMASVTVLVFGLPGRAQATAGAGVPVYLDGQGPIVSVDCAGCPAVAWQHSLSIPNDPALAGLQLMVQSASAPGRGAAALEVSPGVHWFLTGR